MDINITDKCDVILVDGIGEFTACGIDFEIVVKDRVRGCCKCVLEYNFPSSNFILHYQYFNCDTTFTIVKISKIVREIIYKNKDLL